MELFTINAAIEVLDAILLFIYYAFIAITLQNAVLGRAFGVSRLVKIAQDDISGKIFCALLCTVQLITASLSYFALEFLPTNFIYLDYIRPLILVLCTGITFLFLLVACAAAFSPETSNKITEFLPAACFNSCILGTLLITSIQSFNFPQTIGFALGSGIGYSLVLLLLKQGEQRIQNSAVPIALRGLPINLIYLAILSLVIYGFSGNILSF